MYRSVVCTAPLTPKHTERSSKVFFRLMQLKAAWSMFLVVGAYSRNAAAARSFCHHLPEIANRSIVICPFQREKVDVTALIAGEDGAVVRKCTTVRDGIASEDGDHCTDLKVPNPHRFVKGSGDYPPPSRSYCHAKDRIRVAIKHEQFLAGLRIPHSYHAVERTGDDTTPVRSHRHTTDPIGVTCQRAQFVASLQIPNPKSAVEASGDSITAVGTLRHITDRRGGPAYSVPRPSEGSTP